jgi:hypothetical protein
MQKVTVEFTDGSVLEMDTKYLNSMRVYTDFENDILEMEFIIDATWAAKFAPEQLMSPEYPALPKGE